MDEIVDQPGFAVPDVAANQIRTAELIIPVHQDDRAAQPGRDVEGQGGLAGARRPREMQRIADLQVTQRAVRQLLNVGG